MIHIEVQWGDKFQQSWAAQVDPIIVARLMTFRLLAPGSTVPLDFLPLPYADAVHSVRVCDTVKFAFIPAHSSFSVHHFQLSLAPPFAPESKDGDTPFLVRQLPSASLSTLWDSLSFAGDVKAKLVSYAERALELALRGAQRTCVAYHKLILLSGPPGTGKTSVCRAFAQKMCIRMQSSHPTSQLIEISAQSLFSKWFSESGKQVKQVFAQIQEFASDPAHLVFVLVDEVETLTAARSAAFSGSEPADAVRAVNAVLTELDNLSVFSNVFLMATSNLVGRIDDAFLDRVDLRLHIGEPDQCGRASILVDGLEELVKCRIVEGVVPSVGHMGQEGYTMRGADGDESSQCIVFSPHQPFAVPNDEGCVFLSSCDDGGRPLNGEGLVSTLLLADLVEITAGCSGRYLRVAVSPQVSVEQYLRGVTDVLRKRKDMSALAEMSGKGGGREQFTGAAVEEVL